MDNPNRPPLRVENRGRPYDAEARVIALRLRRQIDASPYTIAELARRADMNATELSAVRQALRGDRAARHHVERIAAAFDTLNAQPTP